MEVVPAMSDASPFQRRDVAEWTHRDRLTGVLETARVETDRWAASSATAKHAYGKVVDSRNRSLPDGSAHQRQRQQLEVFQTKGPGGSLQVIRTQTVTSTNSSSSWRGLSSSGPRTALPAITQDFENLQLTLNPIDLSSEKSKASVGRSGSIGTRRPPSRPRSIVGKVSTQDKSTSPHPPQVARICHQNHAETKTSSESSSLSAKISTSQDVKDRSSTASSKSSTITLNGHLSISRKKSTSIEDLHNGVSEEKEDCDEGLKRSSKVRRSLQFPLKKLEARGGVCKLLQELEESSKRNAADSRIARRSFEALENVLKRNNSLTDSSNISERDDGESQRDRDETHTESERSENFNHQSVNSVSIDDFSRKFNTSRSKFILEKRHSLMDSLGKTYNDNDEVKSPVNENKILSKRHSFVTVESLKEVRGRLKRLNSPLDGLDTESGMEELEDNDDGIGTEESTKVSGSLITEIPPLRVKSYVYGIEGMSRSNRPTVLGTGSLESRTSNKASVNGSRSDEWYNRRKSYGFESVHGDEDHNKSSALISKYDDKNRLTSTDSGICRSSEQFAFPSWKRKQQETDSTKPSESEILQVSHSIPISEANEESRGATLDRSRENVRKGRTTVVTFGSKPDRGQDTYTNSKEVDILHRNGEADRTQTTYLMNKTTDAKTEDRGRLCSQPVTVSVPVPQEESSPSVISRRLFFQQLSQGTSFSFEKPWMQQITKNENQSPSLIGSRKIDGDDWWRNSQKPSTGYSVSSRVGNEDWQASNKLSNSVMMKRHSIAVDNSWKSFSNLNKSVHENLVQGSTSPNEDIYRPSQMPDNEVKRHSIAVDKLNYLHDDEPESGYNAPHAQQSREDADNFVSRKQKRVEFCKTEVHFAAEPGRFNIVETDEKPPPNNMFRRRRRHSTPAPDPSKNTSNLPEVRFGDSVYEKQLLGGTEEMEEPNLATGGSGRLPSLPVRVREEVFPEENFTDVNCSNQMNVADEEDDHSNFESSLDPTPRSILKNYKKPKPYLIGEHEESYTAIGEQKEEKWGVRLRPVAQEQAPTWKSTMSLSSRDEVMPTEYSGQSELQKLLRSLRPANPNRSKTNILFPQSVKREDKISECSVAERVRQVEQVASESKGYSTRVNFGAGEATVVDEQPQTVCHNGANQRLYKVSDYPKPVWQRREEAMVTRGNSAAEWSDDVQERPQQQRSVATAILPSYNDSDRLRAVETLVSTRSGQPKITSISLRYGEDNDMHLHQPASTRTAEAFKFTSKTSISSERTNPRNVMDSTSTHFEDKPAFLKSSYTPQTYPFSSKSTHANERNVAVPNTRLDSSVQKSPCPTKERKTFFDRPVLTTSELGSERIADFKQMTTHSESLSRGLVFSSFDKKPFSSQRLHSPQSKPIITCQLPTDVLTISKVDSERSTTGKQPLHSENPSRNSTMTSSLDKELSSKVSQSPLSKPLSSCQSTVTKDHNSTSLLSSKMVSSFESKVPNLSNTLGPQSPKSSSLPYQHGERSNKPASPSHRNSPRSRSSIESHIRVSSNVKLDSTSSSSKLPFNSVQHQDINEKLVGSSNQLQVKESKEKSHSSFGKMDRLSNDGSSIVCHTGKSTLVSGSEIRRVTKSTSESPTPTKKVTPPSKNSKTKDFIGRVGTDSPIYQNGKKSISPSSTLSTSANVTSKTIVSRLEEQPSQSPIYQNSDMFYDEPLEKSNISNIPEQKHYDCGLDLIETDSAILEELTRAADQILQAVNGYTDEESRRASSDDDNRRFKDRRSSTLGTISETPLRKQADIKKEFHKTNGNTRRTQRVSSKTKLGPTSSTSSVESFTRETRRAMVKPERSSSTTTSSRTARMVQRANSRELLLQTNASSSEDIASGTESKKQRAPPPRRSRTSSSTNKDSMTSSTKSKEKQKEGLESSRTKERVSTSRSKPRESSESRESRRKIPETKHHPVKEKTIPAASGLTGGRERVSHARHSTSTRSKKTPNHQEKAPLGKR